MNQSILDFNAEYGDIHVVVTFPNDPGYGEPHNHPRVEISNGGESWMITDQWRTIRTIGPYAQSHTMGTIRPIMSQVLSGFESDKRHPARRWVDMTRILNLVWDIVDFAWEIRKSDAGVMQRLPSRLAELLSYGYPNIKFTFHNHESR